MRTTAPKKAVQKWAATLPDDFLVCRARRAHTLGAYTVTAVPTERVFRETEACAVCGTRRTRQITFAGYLLKGSTYVHPKGYLAPPELGFVDRDGQAVIRLERIRRAT